MTDESQYIETNLLNLLKTLNDMCDRLNIPYKDDFDIEELEKGHVAESEENGVHD